MLNILKTSNVTKYVSVYVSVILQLSASLKHLFLKTATIRSHDKHTTLFSYFEGAEILLFLILIKVSAIPKHVDLLNKKSP